MTTARCLQGVIAFWWVLPPSKPNWKPNFFVLRIEEIKIFAFQTFSDFRLRASELRCFNSFSFGSRANLNSLISPIGAAFDTGASHKCFMSCKHSNMSNAELFKVLQSFCCLCLASCFTISQHNLKAMAAENAVQPPALDALALSRFHQAVWCDSFVSGFPASPEAKSAEKGKKKAERALFVKQRRSKI